MSMLWTGLLAAAAFAGDWADLRPLAPPAPEPPLAAGISASEEDGCPAPAPGAPSGAGLAEAPHIGILRFEPVTDPPELEDDLARASALEAARRTRRWWASRPPGQTVSIGGRSYTAAHLALSLEALEELLGSAADPAELRRRIQARFDVFRSVAEDGSPSGTITGYYDPDLEAAPSPGPDFAPIHARPADLIKIDPSLGLPFDWGRRGPDGGLAPHLSRREVAETGLPGLEFLWTRHPVDLMNLQIQGSGWAILPDGRRLRLSNDGANGHPFRSVGKKLVECGEIPRGTDPSEILRYIRSQTPEREQRLVNVNPRYIYFKAVPGGGGPWGASGLELVPGRSIAVDTRHVPMGLPAFLVSRRPETGPDGRLRFRDFSRFVFAHDIGSAIRGPVRVDLYWGGGRQAEEEARRMLFPGRLYVLVLKTDQ